MSLGCQIRKAVLSFHHVTKQRIKIAIRMRQRTPKTSCTERVHSRINSIYEFFVGFKPVVTFLPSSRGCTYLIVHPSGHLHSPTWIRDPLIHCGIPQRFQEPSLMGPFLGNCGGRYLSQHVRKLLWEIPLDFGHSHLAVPYF